MSKVPEVPVAVIIVKAKGKSLEAVKERKGERDLTGYKRFHYVYADTDIPGALSHVWAEDAEAQVITLVPSKPVKYRAGAKKGAWNASSR